MILVEKSVTGIGRIASRSWEPGERSAVTSNGLNALMPPAMKVLSPQFSAIRPMRASTRWPNTSKWP